MLESYLSILFLLSSIYGYSGLLKNALNKSKKFYGIDFIYGLLFLTVISIFLNLIFPLKYFPVFFLSIGFFLFLIFFWFKCFKINFFLLFSISFFVIFIAHEQGIIYDSQLYHLQILQLNSNNKVIFGIGNLQPHYAMNSSWHSMLGIINFRLLNINFIYIANLCILIIFINEALTKYLSRTKTLSSLFLFLTLSYLLFYSIFHPYNNGTFLNALGSPEVDIPSAILFIITIYLLILYNEKKDKTILELIFVSTFLVVTIKISYAGVFLVALYAIILKKKFFYSIKKLSLFLIFGSTLWFIKSFIYSGCLIFPISFTCFPSYWSTEINEVIGYSNIVQSFARDTPLRQNFTNFEYSLNSFQWFVPWLNEYFLKTEFLLVSFILIFLSFFYFITLFVTTKITFLSLKKNFYFHLFLILIINLLIWMRAPEIRFGYGTIASLVSFLLSILIFKNFQKTLNKNQNTYFIIFVILVSFLFKNYDNLKNLNNNSFVRNFNYSHFENIYASNGYKIFQPTKNSFCNDFKGFCTYQGFRVNIEKKNGYIVIKRNK